MVEPQDLFESIRVDLEVLRAKLSDLRTETDEQNEIAQTVGSALADIQARLEASRQEREAALQHRNQPEPHPAPPGAPPKRATG